MISKLLKNDYSLNLINKVYSMFIGLISSIFLTRYLGVVYRGEYAYLIEIVSILTIIFGLGFNQSYSFFFRKKSGNIFKDFVNFYFFQLIVYSIFAIIFCFIFSNYLLLIYICILMPFSVVKQQMSSAIAVENIRLGILLQMFNNTIKMLSFLILFLFADSNLLFPVLITVGLNIISVFLYLYYMKTIPIPQKTSFIFMREVIKFSWLPMLTSLLITLNYSIDIIFLKNLGTSYELGLYATAAGIIIYIWLIPDSFKEVLVSRVARNSAVKSILLSIKLSIVSVIFIILMFMFFGKFAINILYGAEFVEAYEVTLILSLGAISMVFYKMIGVALLAEGKRWFYFSTLFISVLINSIANFLVIPIYGMYGAAISSVISYSICGITFLIYFMRLKDIKIKELLIISISEIKILVNTLRR